MVEAGDKVLVFKDSSGKFWIEENATPEINDYGLLTNIDGKNIFLTKSSLEAGDYCRVFKIGDKYIARGKAIISAQADSFIFYNNLLLWDFINTNSVELSSLTSTPLFFARDRKFKSRQACWNRNGEVRIADGNTIKNLDCGSFTGDSIGDISKDGTLGIVTIPESNKLKLWISSNLSSVIDWNHGIPKSVCINNSYAIASTGETYDWYTSMWKIENENLSHIRTWNHHSGSASPFGFADLQPIGQFMILGSNKFLYVYDIENGSITQSWEGWIHGLPGFLPIDVHLFTAFNIYYTKGGYSNVYNISNGSSGEIFSGGMWHEMEDVWDNGIVRIDTTGASDWTAFKWEIHDTDDISMIDSLGWDTPIPQTIYHLSAPTVNTPVLTINRNGTYFKPDHKCNPAIFGDFKNQTVISKNLSSCSGAINFRASFDI